MITEKEFLFGLMVFMSSFGLIANVASLISLIVTSRSHRARRMTKAVALFGLLSLTGRSNNHMYPPVDSTGARSAVLRGKGI